MVDSVEVVGMERVIYRIEGRLGRGFWILEKEWIIIW